MELLDIVDENDEVIGSIDRSHPDAHKSPKRIVHVFVFDDQGRMLLQKRNKHLKFKPGAWATAACGHVHSGESYEEGGLRELKEEIGIEGELEYVTKERYEPGEGRPPRFVAAYRLQHNGPFTVDPEEVEKVEWFTLDEIRRMIEEGADMHPETLMIFKKQFNVG